MGLPLLGALDVFTGRTVESAIGARRRRRLRRAGPSRTARPPADSATCGLPVIHHNTRPSGCSFEILIDGSEALPGIARGPDRGSSLARVHIAGWHLEAQFRSDPRCPGAKQLRLLLGELAERIDVRVLLWAGAPAPVFNPSRAAKSREVHAELTPRSTLFAAPSTAHERPMHCHHEKLVIVDDRVAFVGGIDLTSLGGRRFDSADTSDARPPLGWHDSAGRIRGPSRRGCGRSLPRAWRAVHPGARLRESARNAHREPGAHRAAGGPNRAGEDL